MVVYGRIPRDDADDRRRDFLPSVQLFLGRRIGGSRRRTKLEKPCAQRIDVKRLAVEFRLDRRFALQKFSRSTRW